MPDRKSIPKDVETRLLTDSRRRCCLCVFLDGQTDQVPGQIAHLDKNPSNATFENLAWLCMRHHDQYDSRTSQSKGLTIDEVKAWRSSLYAQHAAGISVGARPGGAAISIVGGVHIEGGVHLGPNAINIDSTAGFRTTVDVDGVDRALFRKFLQVVPSKGGVAHVREVAGAGWIRWDDFRDLDTFMREWDDAEHEFVDTELEQARKDLMRGVREYTGYVAQNTFPVENYETTGRCRIPPEWEIDQPELFERVIETIDRLAVRVINQHAALVRLGRAKLQVSSV